MSDIQTSFKEIGRDLWANKPLFITVIVGVAVVAYLLYKKNGASAFVAPGGATPANDLGLTGNTFNNTYTTINKTVTNPVTGKPVPVPGPIQTVFPAPKGTLSPAQHGAGKGDTNWWPYLIQPNQTLGSVTKNVAKWGTVGQLVQYRNNLQIFSQMGIDTSNPNSPLPAGWSISV